MLKNLSELLALKLQTGKLVKSPLLSRKKSGDGGGRRPDPTQGWEGKDMAGICSETAIKE